jgi:hypothetical protein
MEEKRNACKILAGKPEGKILLGISRYRWEDSIEMDLREIGWGGIHWIDLAEDLSSANHGKNTFESQK